MTATSPTLRMSKVRVAAWLGSLFGAYLACAVSGVNRAAALALKRYYVFSAPMIWGLLAIGLLAASERPPRSRWKWLLIGGGLGYSSAAIVYQIAPVIVLGSFSGAASAIRTTGLLTYVGVSILFPLLTFSWLAGVIASALFAAVSRRTACDMRIASSTIIATALIGWVLFGIRRELPIMW